jgi:SNF2 family DNA or RNA helicase
LTICDSDPETGASAKLEHIVDRLGAVASQGEKAVVFSYRLRPLGLLEAQCDANGLRCMRLDGRMSIDKRNHALSAFRYSHFLRRAALRRRA